MGKRGDPNEKASIAIDNVSFDNKTCEKLPQGKFMVALYHYIIIDSVSIVFF